MLIMIGEAFPLRVRGFGAYISNVANWTANLVVASMFPFLFEKLGADLFMFFCDYGDIISIFHKI